MKFNKKIEAFTLIEVIIVLAIIAIILVIAIPSFTQIRNKARKKADIQTCETIKRAVNAVIVDEILLYSPFDKGKIIIDCKDRTYNNKPTIVVSNIEFPTSIDAQNRLEDYFKEFKVPQQSNGGGYTVIIETDGSIQGVSVNEHVPGYGVVGGIIDNTFIGNMNE